MNKSWLGPAVLLSLVALAGCGGGGSNVPSPQPPSSTSVAAATPVFSPPSGTYSSAQTVTISDSTPGATIYYTTDGTTPTTASAQYTSAIAINSTATIQAIATASGYTTSAVAASSYTITPAASAGCAPGQPSVSINVPSSGASQLSGQTCNVDATKDKIVIYVLTNQWYVQPFVNAPFTNINPDGSWSNYTHPWNSIVVLVVDPATYSPAATKITNPALDPNVIAWASYPSTGQTSLKFSGYTWGVKSTGSNPGDQFDPGPNFWSNDPSIVNVATDGLHLKIGQLNGVWQSAEVYLQQSLGYGIYTVQVSSPLDQLDRNTVAAPLFIYASPTQELDNEYSGSGGLIPSPNNAQFVVQPYTVPGNLVRYLQPSTSQFTTQMDWESDHVTFIAWNGWSSAPAAGNIIYQWTYTGGNIPSPGQERVHINLWLLSGSSPVSGTGDQMVINSFAFTPAPGTTLSVVEAGNGTVTSSDASIDCGTVCSSTYASGTTVTLTATPASGWTLANWSGCDSVNGNICTLTMKSTRTATATFTPITYVLTVANSGGGTVTSSDGHINCGSACSYSYSPATLVTLTAMPASGGTFSGWSGCDSVNGNICTVTMNNARTAIATFAQNIYTLTVSVSGNGVVNSADGFIKCGTICSHVYPPGALVTLTPAPSQGWALSAWGGACSGNHSCVVTMTQSLSVTATFAQSSSRLVFTTLVDFGGTNGANPYGMSLIEGADGNFYGTTSDGGNNTPYNNDGSIFKITPGGMLTTLYSFCALTSCSDGYQPDGGLVQATDGNFYGTTGLGGAYGAGTIFKITPGGTLTTLHSFGGGDGAVAYGGLVQATDGNFYGMTWQGGVNGHGTIFKITPTGTLTTLHSFNGTDGANPFGGLVQATDGNFYGTTTSGGANGFGTIFEITPAGTLTTLYSFAGPDGASPYGGLVQAADGDFYGTTYNGGANNLPACTSSTVLGCGTVFRITPEGSLTTLHSFDTTDGWGPAAPLVQASDGNFYGNTSGWKTGSGTIFEITAAGTLTTLHSFTGADGAFPFGGLLQATDGKFYGTTYQMGSRCCGTVFSLDTGLP